MCVLHIVNYTTQHTKHYTTHYYSYYTTHTCSSPCPACVTICRALKSPASASWNAYKLRISRFWRGTPSGTSASTSEGSSAMPSGDDASVCVCEDEGDEGEEEEGGGREGEEGGTVCGGQTDTQHMQPHSCIRNTHYCTLPLD
jgi:hypothetical protein